MQEVFKSVRNKKMPPLRTMAKPKCFHNGIILIVTCFKLVTQKYSFFVILATFISAKIVFM